MADPGQVVQEQKSKQGKELTISNNGSAFHLSSPWDQAISAMKGLPHVHLLPLMLPWGRWVGTVASLYHR